MDIINDVLQKTTNEVSPLVKSGITTLTYCVHIGSIFVESFMNKTKKITRDNIDDTEILEKDQKYANGKRNGQTHSCQT